MAKFGMAVMVCEGLLGKGKFRSVLVRQSRCARLRQGRFWWVWLGFGSLDGFWGGLVCFGGVGWVVNRFGMLRQSRSGEVWLGMF